MSGHDHNTTIEPSNRPAPRQLDEIFEDLRVVCHSPGALHEISHLIYRDWVLTIDTHEARVVDSPDERWSTSKLNKNELMLLLGLIVQSTSPQTYSVLPSDQGFEEKADRLLREFHDRLIENAAPTIDPETQTITWHPDVVTLMGREAIYYGAESFYLHQFRKFSRHRYREDGDWLLRNAGMSIRPMIDIALFIANRINAQMNAVGQAKQAGQAVDKGDLTNSLLVAKSDIYKKFKSKTDEFLKRFSTPATGANGQFTGPFTVNAVMIAPLIDIGDFIYVPNQYRLFESIYESPFYWMMADKSYEDAHAKHRGAFLEQTATLILQRVFGKENVFENVKLMTSTTKEVGEIDVLVVYGEFAIIAQAKSKRMTIKARAGDRDALKADFQDAIQRPYGQALACIEHIKAGVQCIDKSGNTPPLHGLPRFFPLVLLSDPFPAITYLSKAMLEKAEGFAPAVWDLGVLDCVTRILPTPIDMLFYLKCRSDTFDRIESDSEYNILGYHLSTKLAAAPDVDGMYLDRDFATVVDDYMISSDLGLEAKRPLGVLERAHFPVVSEIITLLKTSDPGLSCVALDLYDLSGRALKKFSEQILALRREVSATGKAIKAFSIATPTGGFTYAVAQVGGERASHAAEAIGAKHKYDSKKDRWYVILDSIQTGERIDGMLPLVWPWKHDPAEESRSATVGQIFKSTREPFERGLETDTGE